MRHVVFSRWPQQESSTWSSKLFYNLSKKFMVSGWEYAVIRCTVTHSSIKTSVVIFLNVAPNLHGELRAGMKFNRPEIRTTYKCFICFNTIYLELDWWWTVDPYERLLSISFWCRLYRFLNPLTVDVFTTSIGKLFQLKKFLWISNLKRSLVSFKLCPHSS